MYLKYSVASIEHQQQQGRRDVASVRELLTPVVTAVRPSACKPWKGLLYCTMDTRMVNTFLVEVTITVFLAPKLCTKYKKETTPVYPTTDESTRRVSACGCTCR